MGGLCPEYLFVCVVLVCVWCMSVLRGLACACVVFLLCGVSGVCVVCVCGVWVWCVLCVCVFVVRVFVCSGCVSVFVCGVCVFLCGRPCVVCVWCVCVVCVLGGCVWCVCLCGVVVCVCVGCVCMVCGEGVYMRGLGPEYLFVFGFGVCVVYECVSECVCE